MTVKDHDRWEETTDGVFRRRQPDPVELGYPPPTPNNTAVDATAQAITLADKHGLDLATIIGTGKNGRITKTDVEIHLG